MDPHDQESAEQPRQPRNLQDVLRYAIEAGNPETQPAVPEMSPLDPERRQFLEQAIQSLTVDTVRVLSAAIETLKTLSQDTLAAETYQDALDEIADHVDNMDAANDFVKLGGFTIIDSCLHSQHPGIRWRIADIIAQCTQNNPFCQNHALNLRLLEPLIAMVDKDPDEQCKTKAFFAISNIVRDSAVGLKEFMRLNGFSAVKKAMTSNTAKLRMKASFFFNSVVSNQPTVTWDVVSMGFPELLISQLQLPPGPSHEFIASSLLLLVQNNNEALATCKKPDLKLVETLNRIIDDQKTDDSYTELVESSKQLLALVR
uniref:Nucleotide exchange factor Fes1 domain-containing protein n=1 Tax=Lygus hesperus TaxID=30085 RepID=A0A0K8TDS5_LYGHE